MAERPDFAAGARRRDERIVRGDGVGALALGLVHVDPQDRAEQVVELLAGLRARRRCRCRRRSRDRDSRPGRIGCSRRCARPRAIPGGSSRSPGPPPSGSSLLASNRERRLPFGSVFDGVEDVRDVEVAVLREPRMEGHAIGRPADVDQELRLARRPGDSRTCRSCRAASPRRTAAMPGTRPTESGS